MSNGKKYTKAKKNSTIDYTQEYLDKCERKEKDFQKYKEDMKIIWVSTQDKQDIGMYSAGWESFLKTLEMHFKKSQKAGYTRADEVSKFWNSLGFKTGSGKMWTPRLVNLAKDNMGIKHGSKIIYN